MNRIRMLRNEKRISLRKMGNDLHMSFGGIAGIERGEVGLTEFTTKLFADYFDVSTDYLLGLSDERKKVTNELTGTKLEIFNQLSNLSDEQATEVLAYLAFLQFSNQSKK